MCSDRDAPSVAMAEILIEAPLERVWALQSDITNWPTWNRDVKSVHVDGAVARGVRFRWKSGGVVLTSRVTEVRAPHYISWTGRIFGIQAIHTWVFSSTPEGVLVRTEVDDDRPRVIERLRAQGCKIVKSQKITRRKPRNRLCGRPKRHSSRAPRIAPGSYCLSLHRIRRGNFALTNLHGVG